jgi:hypothetical protein
VKVTVKYVKDLESLQDMFHLPPSEEAYEQYYELEIILESIQYTREKDSWTYILGNDNYSWTKAYKHLLISQLQPTFRWLWGTDCQQKHKSLFLVTCARLAYHKRVAQNEKICNLNSYPCELCLLQRKKSLSIYSSSSHLRETAG